MKIIPLKTKDKRDATLANEAHRQIQTLSSLVSVRREPEKKGIGKTQYFKTVLSEKKKKREHRGKRKRKKLVLRLERTS